jgi:hypothetical protein
MGVGSWELKRQDRRWGCSGDVRENREEETGLSGSQLLAFISQLPTPISHLPTTHHLLVPIAREFGCLHGGLGKPSNCAMPTDRHDW